MKASDSSCGNAVEKPCVFLSIESFYQQNDMDKTLRHVNAVAQRIVKIAQCYGLAEEKCFLAALLHDIGCSIAPKDMTAFAQKHRIELDESEKKYPFLLHQQISKILAKEIFEIQDSDILSAVECHTTLKYNPSPYDMALFLADKLSWDEDGKPPFFDAVFEALSVSLEAASLQYIHYMVSHNRILYPHSWFVAAKRYFETLPSCNKG